MTIVLVILGLLAVASFALGLYFRVAEYDILASDKVWDRIAPAAQALVDDDSVADSLAGAITAFAMLTGCGCFVNVLLIQAVKRYISGKLPHPSEAFTRDMEALSEDTRTALFTLFNDLVLFDSLHAPIRGRICRVVHRKRFSRAKYRVAQSVECEEREIVRIATAAESVFAREENSDLFVVRRTVPA